MKSLAQTIICSALGTFTIAGMVACGSHSGKNNAAIDVASIRKDANLSKKDKAEQLALAAEQLVSRSGFMYADLVASESLAVDPHNTRARFWKSALGPVMEMRGIVNRIAPISKATGHTEDYEKFVREVKTDTANKATVDFVMNGPQDIESERDLQDVIARVTLKIDEFRRTVKDLRNTSLEIQLNTDLKNAANDDSQTQCEVVEVSEGVYQPVGCESTQVTSVRLNRADFEALQQAAAGAQVYLTVLNSWDVSGLINVAQDSEGQSADQTIARLTANPSFGKLRSRQALGIVPELGKDLILGIRYAQSMQSELCPTGSPEQSNRPGQLFNKGFCVPASSAIESQLKAVEMMLSGTPTLFNANVHGSKVPVLVNAAAFFKSPVSDLRQLMPVQTNACGDVAAVGDGKLGGAFPTGDLNRILAQQSRVDCTIDSQEAR